MEKWLETHPYLDELAGLRDCIEETLQGLEQPALPSPDWCRHEEDLRAGLPLLLSGGLDLAFVARAADALRHLFERMPDSGMPEQFRQLCGQIRERLRLSPEEAARLVEAQLAGTGGEVTPEEPGHAGETGQGLIRFFAWRALEMVLRPWRAEFEDWVREHGGEYAHCPLCGARPTMARLMRTRGGRKRLLACGCCGVRWEYQRIGCPYCGNDEQDRLSILEMDDEPFRIDICLECQGFIKTYTGEGEEELMLADWSTLHLDALAMRQGYKRLAHSLYGL